MEAAYRGSKQIQVLDLHEQHARSLFRINQRVFLPLVIGVVVANEYFGNYNPYLTPHP